MKEKYTVKAVFTDIDGTLLNRDHIVTEPTRNAIHKITDNNILFTLASSRSPAGIEPIIRKNIFDCCMIAFGGALILDERRNVLYEKGMSVSTSGDVIDYLEKNCPDVTWNIYTADAWIVKDKKDSRVQHEEKVVETSARKGTISDLASDTSIDKILCMCAPEKLIETEQAVRCAFPALSVARSSNTLLEIMQQGVNKADAVIRLCAAKGIAMEYTMAFGDNYNDLEMLEAVKYGVAMGNAPEEIRKKAKLITRDNEHDGIAYILETLPFKWIK